MIEKLLFVIGYSAVSDFILRPFKLLQATSKRTCIDRQVARAAYQGSLHQPAYAAVIPDSEYFVNVSLKRFLTSEPLNNK